MGEDEFAGAAAGQLAAGAGAAVAVRAAAAGAAADLAGAAGPGAGGEAAGEPVEEVVVGPAGDDRGQCCVAVIAGPRRRPARHRATRGAGGAGAVQELVQGQVQLELEGLAGPVGKAPGGEQPPARFFQGVVLAFGDGADVFGPGLLAQ